MTATSAIAIPQPDARSIRRVEFRAFGTHCAIIYSTAIFVLGRRDGLDFAACGRDVEASIQTDTGAEATPGFIRRQVQAA